MAEGVFLEMVAKRGWQDRFHIDSAGTARYHIGELPDPRARETMKRHGVNLTSRSRQFVPADFEQFDYILGMDESNYANILNVEGGGQHADKVWMMRAFDDPMPTQHKSDKVVPDPYYGGDDGFEKAYQLLVNTHNHLLDYIARQEGWQD